MPHSPDTGFAGLLASRGLDASWTPALAIDDATDGEHPRRGEAALAETNSARGVTIRQYMNEVVANLRGRVGVYHGSASNDIAEDSIAQRDLDVLVYGPTTGLILKGYKIVADDVEQYIDYSPTATFTRGIPNSVSNVWIQGIPGGVRAAVKARIEPSSKQGPNPLAPTLNRSLETQRATLKGLAANWDGYGAEPLSTEAIDGFVDELRAALLNYVGPLPDLIPGADGSLQVEWHLERLELIYGIESDQQRYFCLRIGDAAPKSSYGAEASSDFAAALEVHFRIEDDQTAYASARW